MTSRDTYQNLTIIGSTLRNQPNNIKKDLTDLLKQLVIPNIINKRIKILIDKVFPINDKIIALDYLKSNANVGKVLLKHNF